MIAPRVVAIVQARMGSARLPGKSLQPIAGRPLLAHVLLRARTIVGVDAVVLATSVNDRDKPLTWVADDLGILSVTGSEHDVLGRFADAAMRHRADVIMRITGDCPLLAPDVCQRVLACYRSDPFVRYVSNDTTSTGYPDGTDCEVFSASVLREANLAAHDDGEREHVTPFMRTHCASREVLSDVGDWRHLKLSVDCQEDLEYVRRIFGFLPDGWTSTPSSMSLPVTLAAVARCAKRVQALP